jgi:hypothetical protein
MTTFRYCFILLAYIGLAVSSGCGPSGPETSPVIGKVTFGGKPVVEGSIKFWSETDGTLAVGQLNAEGNYQLTTHPDKRGATLGAHRVTIRSVQTVFPGGSFPSTDEKKEARTKAKLIWLVPPRYDDRRTSPLKADVKPGPNTIDFNLAAEKLTP